MAMFPVNAGISELRGVVLIIKEAGGSISISQLDDESELDIDSLLPLVEACKMLGLATVADGIITLTSEGQQLSMKNFADMVSKRLASIEPFSSAISVLRASNRALQTSELASLLLSRGIMLHGDFETGRLLLKSMLLKWAVRTELLDYNAEADSWSLSKRTY